MGKNNYLGIIIMGYLIIYINHIYRTENLELYSIILYILINSYIIIRGENSIEKIIGIIFGISIIYLIYMNNLLSLFITIELISLISYTYLNKAYGYENIHNIIYYYISNSFAGLLILYSILRIYKEEGEIILLNINEIKFTSLSILIISLLIKLGAGPFYYWKVSLYRKLDSKRLLFISIIPNILYLYLIYFFISNYDTNNDFSLLLILFIFLTIFIVIYSFLALSLTNLLLIYSSIFNISLSLFNIFLYYFYPYQFNVFLYFFIYNINLISFLFLLFISNKSILSNPLFKPLFALSAFSFIGFPPTAGFFAKYYLFYYSIYSSSPLLFFIVFLLIVSSIFLAALYLRFLHYIFFKTPSLSSTISFPSSINATISISSIFLYSFSFILPYIPSL